MSAFVTPAWFAQLDIGPHASAFNVARYSADLLPDSRLPRFEEHMLACHGCQDLVAKMDRVIRGRDNGAALGKEGV